MDMGDMFGGLDNPALDGAFDRVEDKIEDTPEATLDQVFWERELAGEA